MSFFFRKDDKPKPGFHAIDVSQLPAPTHKSAPADPASCIAGTPEEVMAAIRIQTGLRILQARRTAQGLREARVHLTAATLLQAFARGSVTRTAMPTLKKEALEVKARRYTAAALIQEQHRRKHPSAAALSGEAGSSSLEGGEMLAPEAFVIRNLDTGEAVSLELGADAMPQGKGMKLSFGTLQQNPQAWEALKTDSKGAPSPLPAQGPGLDRPAPTLARADRAAPRPPPPLQPPTRVDSAVPAPLQDCSRSSPRRRPSPSARTSCACGRSGTCTPRTTRSATSTSLRTCSRRAR